MTPSALLRPFAWWRDGLVEAWLTIIDRRAARQRICLIADEDGFELVAPGAKSRKRQRIERGPDGAPLIPPDLAALLGGRDVDFGLLPEQVLVRHLDPLPLESLPYLDGIVRHHLERSAPWVLSDVLHAYRAAQTPGQERTLDVTVAATARSMHMAAIAALKRAGAAHIRLVADDPEPGTGTFAMPIEGTGGGRARTARLRRRIAVGGATAAALAAMALGAFVWIWTGFEEEIAVLDESIAARRQILLGAQRAPGAQRDIEALVARKRATPAIVVALDQLTGVLPDDTWIAELLVAEGRLKFIGTSRSVARLLPLIEAAPLFAEATFAGPTTRLPDGGDRFSIETKLVAARETQK